MRIAGAGRSFPPHYYSQEQLLEALEAYWGERFYNRDRLEQFFRNVAVGGRHLALPIDRYPALAGWGEANDAWIEVAQEVGERAIDEALERAGLERSEIDALFFVSVTGIATPSVDARLMNRMSLPDRVKRVPIFGLGCVAGAAGIARAADYVRAFPDQVAVLLSVELCSLTMQREDLSIPNLISSGLFGDGAAAVALTGDGRQADGPRVVATRSVFYPDTEEVMGWQISERGFRVVLSAEVPEMVRRHLGTDVDTFLAEQGLARSEIAHWIAHPGGPKVLEAMQETLELPESALARTWESLTRVGNLSSASVLLVLHDTLYGEPAPRPGDRGVLLAMGPGFCSELVLLEW